MHVRLLAGTAVCALALACGDDSSSLGRASEHARPHLPAFARFSRWAQRALANDRAAGDREALAELLFAQLRGDRDVLAAFVRVGADRPIELALPERASITGTPRWQSLRDPELATVHVAVEEPCPIALTTGRTPAGPPARCVLISNAGEHDEPRRALAITIAFRDPTGDATR